jgi:hypothetical protein
VLSVGIQQWCKKTLKANLCRLAFGATIYNLGKTRNAIRHGGNLSVFFGKLKARVFFKGKFRCTEGNKRYVAVRV